MPQPPLYCLRKVYYVDLEVNSEDASFEKRGKELQVKPGEEERRSGAEAVVSLCFPSSVCGVLFETPLAQSRRAAGRKLCGRAAQRAAQRQTVVR